MSALSIFTRPPDGAVTSRCSCQVSRGAVPGPLQTRKLKNCIETAEGWGAAGTVPAPHKPRPFPKPNNVQSDLPTGLIVHVPLGAMQCMVPVNRILKQKNACSLKVVAVLGMVAGVVGVT